MAKSKKENILNVQSPSSSDSCSLVAYEESLERLGGDVDLFKEFVQIFFEDSPSLLENLLRSVDSKDHGEVAKSAHALKGLISNFGAKPCCDLALEFELAGKSESAETMVGQKENMQELYDHLCRELKQLIA